MEVFCFKYSFVNIVAGNNKHIEVSNYKLYILDLINKVFYNEDTFSTQKSLTFNLCLGLVQQATRGISGHLP